MGGEEGVLPEVGMTEEEQAVFAAMAKRTKSNLTSNPLTGAELGSGKEPKAR